MSTPEDARLKQEFEKLRADDRRNAPDFLDTVSAGRRRAVAAGRQRTRTRIFVASALLAAGLAAMVISRPQRSTVKPVREAGSLVSWVSPTAFLLDTPGKRFRSETPRLGNREIYGLPAARKESK